MIVTVGKNGAISLPPHNDLDEKLRFEIGDILICTVTEDKHAITLEKFSDQSLSDEQIVEHGSLCRIEELNPHDFE